MPVADSSVLVAAFDDDDERKTEAVRLLHRARPLWATPVAVAETMRIVRWHAKNRGLDGNSVARDALRAIRGLPGYRPMLAFLEPDVAATFSEDSTLSYADALIVHSALEAGDDLLTFDTNQKRALRRAKAGR